MRYAGFFACISAAAIAGVVTLSSSAWRIILIWLALDGIVLAIAYMLNRPNLVMGKCHGGPSRILSIINLPWLALTWGVAHVERNLSRENASDRIEGTNIWIGRRPTRAEAASFDLVLDLTAEFPVVSPSARAIPNLDGVPLANYEAVAFPSQGRILVHCAQGHGRSATWLAMQLVHNGLCRDHSSALEVIQRARPKARPSRAQLGQLGVRS